MAYIGKLDSRALPLHDSTIPAHEVHGHPKRQPGRHTSTQGPTNAEHEVPRLATLQPAARIMHGGPSTTPQGPTIGERGVLRPPKLQPATQYTMPAAAQQEPDQRPSIQPVYSSQDTIEPNNPFTRERLEAEINRRVEVRLTEVRLTEER